MAVSLNIKGVKSTKAFLKFKDKEIEKVADEAIIKSGFFIEGEVKESIAGHRAEPKSVDTGQFLNSVRTKRIRPLLVSVESDVRHAKFMEFGTSRIRPRRHFNNTAKRNEKKIRTFVRKEIKKIE